MPVAPRRPTWSRFLDRLYSAFDALVDKHGLEKIKVSGDSYMVVSGVPRPRPDHVQALADFALDMADVAAGLKDPHGHRVPLRVGMACGPVVAGVVGSRRFFYDVWGDAVNVASRMESTDSVGRIQVPEDIYERLKDDFVLQERGHIDVKGKGLMRTWYLIGRKADSDESGDLLPRNRARPASDGPQSPIPGCAFVSHCGHANHPGTPLFQACCRICGSPRWYPGILSLILGVLVLAWPGISILVAADRLRRLPADHRCRTGRSSPSACMFRPVAASCCSSAAPPR